MIIRNQYDDTLDMIILRCNCEVDLEVAVTQEEKLVIYKIWYEQVLYLQLQFQEECKLSEGEFLIAGIEY